MITFGLGCEEGYQRTPCDCNLDCNNTHFSTNQEYIDCLTECFSGDQGFQICEDDCEQDPTAIEEARDLCNTDCDEEGDDCRQGCYDACYGPCGSTKNSCDAQCFIDFPGNTGLTAMCLLGCANDFNACVVACTPAKNACDSDCNNTQNLCSFDCETTFLEDDYDLIITEQTCEKNCCSEKEDHPTTCQNECEIDYTGCIKQAAGDSRPCFRACIPMEFDEAILCYDDCTEQQDAAEATCIRTRFVCDNECLVDDMQRTDQCDWFYNHCAIECENTWKEALAACDPPDDAECIAEALSDRYDCRVQCCTDRYGADPYTKCYAACWHSSDCDEGEFVCQDALNTCLEDCTSDPPCFPCGYVATFAFGIS